MNEETKLLLRVFKCWSIGYTDEQQACFFRGMAVGILAASVLLVGFALYSRPWEAKERQSLMSEVSRRSGYSSCCVDMMAIVSHGGNIDALIEFSRVQAETEFSGMVNATNFYPTASARSSMYGEYRLATVKSQ